MVQTDNMQEGSTLQGDSLLPHGMLWGAKRSPVGCSLTLPSPT